MKKFTGTTAGRAAILIVVMMMCLLSAQAATATSSQRSALSERPVAHTKKGDLTSRIVGSTGDGRQVTGSFVPLRFIKA